MANENAGELLTIMTELKVTKEDLIAIQVSNIERDLMERQLATDAEMEQLKREIKDAQKAFEKAVEDRAEGKYGEDIKTLAEVLTKLGLSAQETMLKVSIDRNDKKTVATVGCRDIKRYGHETSVTHTSKFTDDDKRMDEELEEKERHLEQLQRQAIDIRKKLAQMSTLERQSKAAFARSVLEQSDKGKELMARVGEIPGLPELPRPAAQ